MNMDAFLDYVLPDVPGCPRLMALDAVRGVARDFFVRTGIWRHPVFADIDIVTNQTVYPLVPTEVDDEETNIVGIIQPWVQGKKIYKRSPHELVQTYANFNTATGRPIYYWFDLDDQINLYPKPNTDITAGLSVLAILGPKIDSNYFPDQFYIPKWRDGIASGAKAKLMAIPKKPYTDLELSQYHKRQFDEAVTDAFGRLMSGGTFSAEDDVITIFEDR